ncbi:TPA: hypothetical protein KOU56_003987 [Clostridioides difficile]|nr:hypothetical protein [Clostridioides difficile]
MKLKKFIATTLCLATIIGPTSAFANDNVKYDFKKTSSKIESLINNKINKFDVSNLNSSLSNFKKNISINNSEVIDIKKSKANYQIEGSVLNHTDSLINSDKEDMYFFNVDSARTMLMKMNSINDNYIAQLGIVDWNTGTWSGTNVYVSSNQQFNLSSLPVGDYAIRVFSQGSAGDNYTIGMNAENPENATSIIHQSDSLQYVVLGYNNGDVYSQGKLLFNPNKSNPNLDWKRNYYFSWDGNYRARDHKISSAKIKSVSAPISYKSQYVNSDNAIMVYLDKGTIFTYFESEFHSYPSYYYSSFNDITGKKTPRALDTEDFNEYGEHILILDLESNKAIDFLSVLNLYYGSGIEPFPEINFLN